MAVRTQPRFAAWADPLYVFPMPDETPFGLDRSLVGRPVIDYTVSLVEDHLLYLDCMRYLAAFRGLNCKGWNSSDTLTWAQACAMLSCSGQP